MKKLDSKVVDGIFKLFVSGGHIYCIWLAGVLIICNKYECITIVSDGTQVDKAFCSDSRLCPELPSLTLQGSHFTGYCPDRTHFKRECERERFSSGCKMTLLFSFTFYICKKENPTINILNSFRVFRVYGNKSYKNYWASSLVSWSAVLSFFFFSHCAAKWSYFSYFCSVDLVK